MDEYLQDESVINWWEEDDGEFIYITQGEDEILMDREIAIELAHKILETLTIEEDYEREI